jgi:hypothetical protein
MSFQLLPHTIGGTCWHNQPDLDTGNEAFALLAQMWEARHKPRLDTGSSATPVLYREFLREYDSIMREASDRMQRALVDWEKAK